jgi:hypothetical protein
MNTDKALVNSIVFWAYDDGDTGRGKVEHIGISHSV